MFSFTLIISAQQNEEFAKKGKTIKSFLKKGWFEIGRVKADFNNDEKQDIILAVQHKEDTNSDYSNGRAIIILFKDGNGYVLNKVNHEAIMGQHDGGVLDPFTGITVKNNTFTISHYGGTAWRWGFDVQFRFQNNDWF